jgi:ketosteroid isomerase-like protein
MSQENVANIRECFAVFNERGVEAAIDTFGHLLAEDFGLEEASEMPDRERHSGKQGFLDNLSKLGNELDELRIEPLEFVDLDDKLVVEVLMAGRGRSSGAPVEMKFAQLWSLRDGKAVSLRDFATKEEALEAAGLSE